AGTADRAAGAAKAASVLEPRGIRLADRVANAGVSLWILLDRALVRKAGVVYTLRRPLYDLIMSKSCKECVP
ncbi:MAG: hypothetical protein JW828_08785, partial [Sedimentisphaerales bacterium]|nr:hypothetical protein [Sedimentisphaerales bacterium]